LNYSRADKFSSNSYSPRNSSVTETFMDNFRTNDLKEMQIHSSV